VNGVDRMKRQARSLDSFTLPGFVGVANATAWASLFTRASVGLSSHSNVDPQKRNAASAPIVRIGIHHESPLCAVGPPQRRRTSWV